MEKKRKERVRSSKSNTITPTILSPDSNTLQDKSKHINQINNNSKKGSTQLINDKIDHQDDIQTSNSKSTKALSSRKPKKNAVKTKSTPKGSTQNTKNNKNKALSPTNVITRSQNKTSKNDVDLNEGSEIEDNFISRESSDNSSQDNSLTFSPIHKKVIKSSPPPTPYNNNNEKDAEIDIKNESSNKDNFSNNGEVEEENNSSNNSSFTQLITSKCDLKAELQAAIQVNKQLKERDAMLQKRITELNHQSKIAHQVLEDRLNELREENVRLNELLEQLPSDERLNIEYISLTTFPIEDDDIEPLIKIGILEEGENMSVLKERLDDLLGELRYYESLYDIVAQYGEDGFQPKFFLSYFDDSYSSKTNMNSNSNDLSNELANIKLANELKHKINILVKSSDCSSKMARRKVAKLEKEIDTLRKELQDKRTMASYRPSESSSILLNQSGSFSLQDVQSVLLTAGGDSNLLKQITGNTFSYKYQNKKEITFNVEAICGRPYVTLPNSNNIRKQTLFSFFKGIIS